MLLSFELSNHKSFRNEHELQLMPSRDNVRPAVSVAAIYGANASGKSNLLDGLGFMHEAVIRSFRTWDAKSGIPRSPFRLDEDALREPSSFTVQLRLDEIDYLYGFIVDDEMVHEEWLYSYPRRKKRIIFERHASEIRLGSTLTENASRLDILRKLIRPNSLVLSAAAQTPDQPEFEPVYDWFRSHLQLRGLRRLRSTRRVERWSSLIDVAMKRHPSFIELVRIADMGITDMRIERSSETVGESSYEGDVVVFVHGNDAASLYLKDQSEGTISWIQLLPAALDVLLRGSVLVVDELDTSLHPRLLARLVELFRDGRTNMSGAQLIFTTHDATLLGTNLGVEVLARDEIWFVEKSRKNESSLIALTDFHPRKEDNRERRYLNGSYGGVPDVYSDSLVAAVLRTRESAKNATP